MDAITIAEIAQAVGGVLLGDFTDPTRAVTQVSIDSRSCDEGALFLPLVGARFDGHAFIQTVLEAGAAGCLTQRARETYLPGKFYIKVDSTLKALRDLAVWYRARFHIPFIAITGSVGKTTTKDMIAAVLGEKFRVLKTDGNQNNGIGLPLTILRLSSQDEMCVLELGMNHEKEIDDLAAIARPDVAIITNIGDAHIEHLGSRENILKAKSEVLAHLNPKGCVVLSGDDALLCGLAATLPFEHFLCGTGADCAYRADDVRTDGEHSVSCTVTTPQGSFPAEIPALGSHMLYPTLMAAAVCQRFGMTNDEIVRGIARFAPTKMRMNILKCADDITILDDAYNANPQSMRAAVEVLAKAGGSYKVAVLGDMFKLGSLAPALHEGVGDYLGKAGIDSLVAIGALARHIFEAAVRAGVPHAQHCATKEEAMALLAREVKPHATILVKASRGMAFEELVAALQKLAGER